MQEVRLVTCNCESKIIFSCYRKADSENAFSLLLAALSLIQHSWTGKKVVRIVLQVVQIYHDPNMSRLTRSCTHCVTSRPNMSRLTTRPHLLRVVQECHDSHQLHQLNYTMRSHPPELAFLKYLLHIGFSSLIARVVSGWLISFCGAEPISFTAFMVWAMGLSQIGIAFFPGGTMFVVFSFLFGFTSGSVAIGLFPILYVSFHHGNLKFAQSCMVCAWGCGAFATPLVTVNQTLQRVSSEETAVNSFISV